MYETDRGSAVIHGAFGIMRDTDITQLILHTVTVLQNKIIKTKQSFNYTWLGIQSVLNVTFSDTFMLAELYQEVLASNAIGNSFCVYFIRNERDKAVLEYISLSPMSLSLHPVHHPNCKQVPRSAKDSIIYDLVGREGRKMLCLWEFPNYFVDLQWKLGIKSTNTLTFCVSPVSSVW